ncbi:MAG: hypothetical protein GY778_05445, partial [bacterium]|nr:hypothetical protein [bacterium]
MTIQPGEAWVTIDSPVEGTSQVTAVATQINPLGQRSATAVIHWVDAQWVFPPPAVNPTGSQHTFTTTVTRRTSGAPIAGWPVRYEIVGGPPAGFAPDGKQVVEVATTELGQANVEIVQATGAGPGTSRVGVQVMRPAPANAAGAQRLILGVGTTTRTWTAPNMGLRVTGPPQASVGESVSYRVEVTNHGKLAVTRATVTAAEPDGLAYVSSKPPATV